MVLSSMEQEPLTGPQLESQVEIGSSQPPQRLGGVLRHVGLFAAGAVAVLAAQAGVGPNKVFGDVANLGAVTNLADSDESCKVPKDFCKGTEMRHDTLSMRDCDGDGILDPYCEGGELLRFGYFSSKNGCKSNWPNGLCKKEKQPGKDEVSDFKHAASNEITVIHFNDVYNVAGILEHGRRSGGMSRAMKVVNDERKRNPDRTFVVFAGDLLSPSALSDLFKGAQMIDILNHFKLDVASLGNHEFDFGLETLGERIAESKFKWLNTNLMDEKGKLLNGTTKHFIKEVPWAPRWGKSKKKTLKVCFFGVAYDVRETMLLDVDRVQYSDVLKTAEEEATFLKEKKKCDVVMPLTHQFSVDDCKLSAKLGKKVDLILGGHDHSTEFTSVCGHAPYVKAASDLTTQWVMSLFADDDGVIDSVDGRLLALTEADPFDEFVHDEVVKWEEKGEEALGQKIGCLDTGLNALAADCRTKETNMGNFFTDAVRKMHKTDVAIINGGTMRGNVVFSKGDLTKKTVLSMHPFGNLVYKIYVTGKQLKEYINDSVRCVEKVCGDFVQISGMKYEFDSTKDPSERLVKLMTPDGKEVDDDKEFSLAITNYMFSSSKLQKNKLYNMGTLNDAVPLILSLYSAFEKTAADDKCISAEVEGRIVDVAK